MSTIEAAVKADDLPFRPLESTFVKNGFTYELVLRDGDLAIYKQRLSPGLGCLAYEVIRIRVKEESIVFGNVVPRREVAPSNEDFGVWGWTFPTLERAKDKFSALRDAPPSRRR